MCFRASEPIKQNTITICPGAQERKQNQRDPPCATPLGRGLRREISRTGGLEVSTTRAKGHFLPFTPKVRVQQLPRQWQLSGRGKGPTLISAALASIRSLPTDSLGDLCQCPDQPGSSLLPPGYTDQSYTAGIEQRQRLERLGSQVPASAWSGEPLSTYGSMQAPSSGCVSERIPAGC